jgi:flagellar protein FliO/FliZ
MPVKIMLCWLLLLWFPGGEAMPGSDIPKQTASRTVASGDIAAWSIGLLVVLSVFFLCVWGVRKLSGLTVSGAEKMRVVGGLSLGMREKVILLQVGKKQLVLGVTPGRIETLHVLEGDDCLLKEETVSATAETGFAQKLLQAIKARTEHSRSGPP